MIKAVCVRTNHYRAVVDDLFSERDEVDMRAEREREVIS